MPDALKIDLQRLRSLIVERTGPGKGMTRRGLSMKATGNKNPDLVRDIMRVDKRRPTIEAVSGLCAAMGVDLGEIVHGTTPSRGTSNGWLSVMGAVAAGVWREQADWPDTDQFQVNVGPYEGDGDRYGLVVEGRSMDRTLPPGTILECVKLIGSGLTPEPGDYVIAERQRDDLYERTVKRLSVTGAGDYQLIAESTLPEFQAPIFIGKPDEGVFGNDETRVIALVVQAHLVLHKSKRRTA